MHHHVSKIGEGLSLGEGPSLRKWTKRLRSRNNQLSVSLLVVSALVLPASAMQMSFIRQRYGPTAAKVTMRVPSQTRITVLWLPV